MWRTGGRRKNERARLDRPCARWRALAGHAHGGAAGNVCTEDLAFLCEQMGIATGLHLPKLLAAARLAERIIGRRREGKLMHSGLPSAAARPEQPA